MTKIKVLLAALAIQTVATGAFAVTKTWVAAGSGNWSVGANWSGGTIPLAADDVLLDHSTVVGAYTVTHDANVLNAHNCKSLTVGAGGSTITLLIPTTATVAGSLQIAATAAVVPTNTFVVENGGRYENQSLAAAGTVIMNNLKLNNKSLFKNGSYLRHNATASLTTGFPADPLGTTNGGSTFQTTSTVEVGPTLNTAAGGVHSITMSNYSFGNIIFNPTPDSLGYYSTVVGSATTPGYCTINGTFTIATGTLFLANVSDSDTSAFAPAGFIFKGDIVNNGTIVFDGRGGTNRNTGGSYIDGSPSTLSGTGVYTITGNLVDLSATFPPGTLTINAGKSMVLNSAMVIQSGTATGTLSTHSALQCSELPVTGTGTITVQANASLRIKHPGGFAAQFAGLSAPPTVNVATNYRFNATSAQVTSTGMPSVAGSVTFMNNSGVTLSKALTVNGTVAFTSGTVTTTPTESLLVGPANASSRAKGYVVGDGYTQTLRGGVNAYARTIHVGTGSQYSPISITLNGTTATTGTLKVVPTATQHPNVTTPGKAIKRFWTLTPTTLGPFNANLTFTYDNADIVGLDPGFQEFTLKAERRNGAVWEIAAGSTNAATNTTTATGVTALSPWTLEAVAITAANPIWQEFGD